MQPGKLGWRWRHTSDRSSRNSRFDRAVLGETASLTAQEQIGFNVFMGARCAICHCAVQRRLAAMLVESEPR
jgi:hypothetical protein